MKLKDVKITSQLKYGLGTIIVLVLALGAISWYQSSLLWAETEGMYEHPLQVRRHIGEIRADILNIALDMKEIFLADSEAERQPILRAIEEADIDATGHFDQLYEKYLGPKEDIDSAYSYFIQWRTVRAETLRLLALGQITEAESRTKISGIQGQFIQELMRSFEKMSDFQIARGDQYYQDAQQHQTDLAIRLLILLGIIFLSVLTISYIIIKNIREPLSEMLVATQEFSKGKLGSRSRYKSNNEFGKLSSAFNTLTESLQSEMQRKDGVAKLSEVMLQQQELHGFCEEMLQALLKKTQSQIAALYLLNDEKTDFDHFTSIGLSAQAWSSFSASGNEGEFGAAIATKKIHYIKKIPADARLTFSTVAGDFIPREIITIPILLQSEVVAVISLASIRSYTSESINLVNDILQPLTDRMNGVLAFGKLEALFSRLQSQNQELDSQRMELTQQRDEMNEQNIELEMQKRELNQAAKIKNNFLARMSHELRTPLNSVLALSGVLSRRLKKTISEEELSYLEVITRNGRQLLDLINDILDLSRIESGNEDIRMNKFSLPSLIHDLFQTMEPQAKEKKIDLRLSISEAIPEMVSDYAKCNHILQNVVANAVKFTEKGEVVISALPSGDKVVISVSDTGIGIDERMLPFIFDEFRQVDESMGRSFTGTGLGLAIAKKYAELLQGSIEVQSELGKGSVLTVILPIKQDGEHITEWVQREAGLEKNPLKVSPTAGLGKTILVVEDSEPAIIQLQDILSNVGFQVEVARNGREALVLVKTQEPDAMILDLMMPEVDGFEVLKTVRAESQTVPLPVLILTAKHLSKEELSFLKGNNVYQMIQKGDVGRDELLHVVSKMVHGK
ncbi:ATP-binding protein [Bacteroidota bacterium]